MGSQLFLGSRKGGMQWFELQWFYLLLLCVWSMNGLTSEYIDSCARELGAKRLCLQMPWEQSHANTVLGGRPKPTIPVPDWVDFPVQSSDHSAAISRPTRLNRFNTKLHLSEVSWLASENKKLNVALQCWKVIVLDSTCHSDFGKLLMQCIELGRSDDYVWQVISDAFSNKSAATLRARSASLLSFGRWKKTAYPGSIGGIFPITEEMAYDYLCDLRVTKAAPSRGTRFLEALGFSKGLIGADVDSILKSARVKGVAYGQAHKATRKKSPLTVQQVVLLERLATFGNGQEAVFAGYLCFLVHARLRWSDGQHCIKEPQLDVTNGKGFLEAALYHHKTAQKRRTKVVRLLPVAGVLPGVSGCDWATQWLKKRAEMGLRASMQEPTMPAPTSAGGWTRQPLTSSEASVWMRELLQPWSPENLRDIATHSSKATVLSWMSKSNVDISLRRLAGYHIAPGDKSALEYSRDAAAPVLRQIEAIFIAVRANLFRPDLPRSQRWLEVQTLEDAVKLAALKPYRHGLSSDCHSSFDATMSDLHVNSSMPEDAQSLERDMETWPEFGDDTTLLELKKHSLNSFHSDPAHDMVASDISDDVSSRESSSDSDSASEDLERRALLDGERNAVDLVAPSDLANKECFKHKRSQKLHLVGRTSFGNKFFKCGRKCNENYEGLSTVPAFAAHGCMTCFGWSQKPASDSSE